MSKETENLEAFSGWDNAADIDFFGEDSTTAVEETKEETTITTEEEETTTETEDDGKETTVADTEEKEEEIDFFSETEIEADDKGETITEDEKEAPVNSNVSTLNFLKEKGMIDFELEEGEELSDERAAELLEDKYEETIDNKISGMLKDLPPVTKSLLQYAIKGGNEAEFLAKLNSQPSASIGPELDMEKEENQILVVKKDLEKNGYDKDYIDSNIEYLKDSGKLKSISEKVYGKIVADDEKEREAEVERMAQQKATLKERQKAYKADLTEYTKSLEEIKGLKLNDKEKTELPQYMSDPKIKTDSGEITQFQKDLFDALQDKDTSLLMAKLIKSKFDFSSLANAEKTKQAKKIRDDIRRTKPKTGSSQSVVKKSLADYFD